MEKEKISELEAILEEIADFNILVIVKGKKQDYPCCNHQGAEYCYY